MVEALRIGTFEPRGAANKKKITAALLATEISILKW
jgi:hypothetical protein